MKLAIVRIRGSFHLSAAMKSAFAHMKLNTKNSCVIVDDTPSLRGVLTKVKDYVTWGPVDEETVKALERRKSKDSVYRLHPPKKGYGKKGIKVSFSAGGALGNRGAKINELLKQMI
ncbi:hypothetical protein GF342_01685 [Candidatus Woesearchaeota archaeon]|nr:hypothetical protein [Candidatus Woesearchaeota archaeon]